jgi:predicted nucleic acid-binding Zn ribbon protein
VTTGNDSGERMDRDDDMHSHVHAEPAFRAGADPEEDAFVALGNALERVRAELGLPDAGAFDVLLRRWPEIVGSEVAAHARLASVRDGVAVIVADGPIWASQLRFLEAAIVDGAAGAVGAGVVREVRVRVGT